MIRARARVRARDAQTLNPKILRLRRIFGFSVCA
jgi:acetolactate synthase regulatory subunit